MTKKERLAAAIEREKAKRKEIDDRIADLERQHKEEEALEIQKMLSHAKVNAEELKALLKKASLIED